MATKSKAWELNKADFKKRLKNTLVFLAPALLIFLIAIQSGIPVDEALLSVYTWGLSTAIDLTKKFISSN